MGTIIRLSAEAPTEAMAKAAIELAWSEVRQVDERLHPSRPGSDLAALHAAAVGERVPASALTLGLLRRARALHMDSGGYFDPCLPEGGGTLADLEVGPRNLRRRAPLRLDLGGIAKGHAVDRALLALRRGGCSAGAVDAGGDLRVFGREPESVRIGRSGPVVIDIANAALAVSEPSSQAPPGHRGYYSRVTGAWQQAGAAAVLAPTAAEADALATCALFMPAEQAAALCARRGAQLLPCTWLQPGSWAACAAGWAQRSQLTQPESPLT